MAGLFSYTEGAYGHRVRVFRRPGRDNIYIAAWDAEKKRMVPTSLGHANEERARKQCRDLSDALRLGAIQTDATASMAPSETGTAVPADIAPTAATIPDEEERADDGLEDPWDHLLNQYHEIRGRHKKGEGPKEDLRRQKIWKAFVALKKIEMPEHIDDDHVEEFGRMRRRGTLVVPGVALTGTNQRRADVNEAGDVVSLTTVRADIIYLATVLNWASTKRIEGKPILAHPVKIKVPSNLKTPRPKRPVATRDDVLDLIAVADDVDETGLFRCFLHLHDGMGWRVCGVCNISGADVDLEPSDVGRYGTVAKNWHVDKEGMGDLVPLSRRSRAALLRAMKIRGIKPGEDRPIFITVRSRQIWSRFTVRDYTNRAEKLANIAHIGGSHAFRRKWVTERKDHPVADIMEAGGWVDPRSLDSYLQSDPETTFEVVTRPTRRIRRLS